MNVAVIRSGDHSYMGTAAAVIMAMVVAMTETSFNGCNTNYMQGLCRCSELTWLSV